VHWPSVLSWSSVGVPTAERQPARDALGWSSALWLGANDRCRMHYIWQVFQLDRNFLVSAQHVLSRYSLETGAC